ncbi:MAG: hypothetical protein QXD62_00030 [Candidatus Woesearchaeota archaeon]
MSLEHLVDSILDNRVFVFKPYEKEKEKEILETFQKTGMKIYKIEKLGIYIAKIRDNLTEEEKQNLRGVLVNYKSVCFYEPLQKVYALNNQ